MNSYHMWAELPSPLKAEFQEVFWKYAAAVYERDHVILTSYIPSEMGGSMPKEDYLIHMSDSELPEMYVTMSYGECSSARFAERFLKTGVYKPPRVFGYFPEYMVIDRRRLGERPVPDSYEKLCEPIYQGEICLIGSPRIPDPTAALYLYRKCGREAMQRFVRNIAGFASPVDTIRHIGKSTNRFGAIFLMPALFAEVCAEKRDASLVIPADGVIAEPLTCLERQDAEKSHYIREFLFSEPVRDLLENKRFFYAGENPERVLEESKHPLSPEVEVVYREISSVLSKR